jgi:hypothetical protein
VVAVVELRRLALLPPAPILRAAYRQLWRDWAER